MMKHCIFALKISVFFLATIGLALGGVPDVHLPNVDWSPVEKVLNTAIIDGAFPGCVAAVGNKQGVVYMKAFGSFTYGVPPPYNSNNPPMTLDTLFDMASCTKVTACTSSAAQFYQRGELSLETPVWQILGKDFASNGKEKLTVLNLLLHNSGFAPDPVPWWWETEFGCPESFKPLPELSFSCMPKIWESLMNQTLINPIGEIYVYSDLNFITLAQIIGTLSRELGYVTVGDLRSECFGASDIGTENFCYYEAYVRKYFIEALNLQNTQYLPPTSLAPICAPTENDTVYLHRVIQGQVSDGNTFASGGISGHAGLFSNVKDMSVFMHRLMFAAADDSFLNRTTVDYFIKEYNHTQSSRALGWNTNDPGVFDWGWNLTCGNMSSSTFLHTGYTGTMLCGDPTRELFTILLTNRVYPTDTNEKIHKVRVAYNSAVVGITDRFKKMRNSHDDHH